ncbi:MAG: PDDEXK family nuclease [Acidiferrobacterales bacterium]
MKWLRTLVIFDRGDIVTSSDWRTIHDSYIRSIQSIDFPEGAGTLTLRRKIKRPDGQWNRNGVGYLRRRFLDHVVKQEGWRAEVGFDLGKNQVPPELRLYPSLEPYREPISSEFGNFDLVTTAPGGVHVAIEWETGNISSSHRSMNKLAIALGAGKVQAGVLIVPSRNLYEHLTDRIGNIGELSGYLSMWRDLEARVERGLLAISVVEHDFLTDDRKFPYLPSGNDGRARQGQAKKR